MDNKIDAALYGITHNPDHVIIPNFSRETAGFPKVGDQIISHDLPKISKGTIGEKMMNREYNGLGTHDIMGIKRVNELIDELITYMDEGDTITITITGGHDREFTVVIDSTRIQKPKVDNVTLVKANDETVAVQLPDGRIIHIDKEQIDG